MAIEKITIQQYQQFSGKFPVLDVRSPGEYLHAHIPGAYNLPLFTNEERHVVGTAYKQQSKQAAIKKGLQYFGGKMVQLLEEAENIVMAHNEELPDKKTVIVHCWRGGMRSAGVAWLLDLYGFKVYTIIGGYKSFRRWCASQFTRQYSFKIIGGFTGSGKTEILQQLLLRGHNVIDLEQLAHHKGSAFGDLGQQAQPMQEMFENQLAIALKDLESTDCVWIEDESRRIGTVSIPDVLYLHIQTRPVYFLEVPFEERLKYIVKWYGSFKKEKLAGRILRLQKRLGGMETKMALEHLDAGDIYSCFGILLKYYDKYYLKCLQQKNDKVSFVKRIFLDNTDATANADIILSQTDIHQKSY